MNEQAKPEQKILTTKEFLKLIEHPPEPPLGLMTPYPVTSSDGLLGKKREIKNER